jgi:hypothetical protein
MSKTPLNWFMEFPAQMTSSPTVIMLNATARGIYVFMRYHCWLNIAQDGGIPNSDAYIQAITNCTAAEWQDNKALILPNFEERDGKLFVPEFEAQAANAYDVVGKRIEAGKASGRARREKAKSANLNIKTDDDDETDRLDRQTDSVFSKCSTHVPLTNDEQVLNTCSPTAPAPSSLEQRGVSSPHDSPTSGHLAAPTSGVPIPSASLPTPLRGASPSASHAPAGSTTPQERSTPACNDNSLDDVRHVRAACLALGAKLPQESDVRRLLATYSAEEITGALEDYSDQEDANFLEYRFFVEGAAEILLPAHRKKMEIEARREARDKQERERVKQAGAGKPYSEAGDFLFGKSEEITK